MYSSRLEEFLRSFSDCYVSLTFSLSVSNDKLLVKRSKKKKKKKKEKEKKKKKKKKEERKGCKFYKFPHCRGEYISFDVMDF